VKFSHVRLLVDDVARISGVGGAFVGEPSARPDSGIRVACPRDPAGNLVELHETIPAHE
jgi:hypothetical protein